MNTEHSKMNNKPKRLMYRDLGEKKEETQSENSKAHGQKHVILYPFFKIYN